MVIDPRAAAKIRRLYFDDRLPIVQIAQKTGISPYRVTMLVKFNQWDIERAAIKRRELWEAMGEAGKRAGQITCEAISAHDAGTAGNAASILSLPPLTKVATTEADLVQRLYNAIDETLAEIEKPARSNVKSGGEYDRKTRAISSMVRSLEKVLEIKVKQAQANDQSGGVAAEKVRADAEQLRRDIAERLERLQRKRKSQSPSR